LLKLNAKISEESVKLLQIDFAKINNIKMAAIITNAVKLWKEMEKLYIQGAKTSKQNVQIDIKNYVKETKLELVKLKVVADINSIIEKEYGWKEKEPVKLQKKCNGVITSCRRIKLINNCYKNRCLTTVYKNNKNYFKEVY